MESSFLFGESFIRFDVAFLALQQTNQNLCTIGSDHGLFLLPARARLVLNNRIRKTSFH